MFKRDQVLLQLRQVPDVFLHVLRVFLLVHFILISMQVALLPISSIQHFLP